MQWGLKQHASMASAFDIVKEGHRMFTSHSCVNRVSPVDAAVVPCFQQAMVNTKKLCAVILDTLGREIMVRKLLAHHNTQPAATFVCIIVSQVLQQQAQ
jgi:hypothetical protein